MILIFHNKNYKTTIYWLKYKSVGLMYNLYFFKNGLITIFIKNTNRPNISMTGPFQFWLWFLKAMIFWKLIWKVSFACLLSSTFPLSASSCLLSSSSSLSGPACLQSATFTPLQPLQEPNIQNIYDFVY